MIRSKELPGQRASGEWGTFKSDVTKLREDVAGLAEALIQAGRQGAGEAKDKLQEEARERLSQLRGTVDEAKAVGRSVFGYVEDQISERPLTSVLVALATGIVLGKLLDRK